MAGTHDRDNGQLTQNQNNAMSDDPKDGNRRPTRGDMTDDPPPGEMPEDQQTPQPEDFGGDGDDGGE